MAEVVFDGASRVYPGSDHAAVDRLSLEIADGEFVVLVGPSGSGKSTALRMLGGLEPTDDGRILIGGADVTDVAPKDRDVAMVFQSYALYPHMTVARNIGFHLRLRRRPKDEIARRVAESARLLDLEQYLDRRPANLSGGQRQRVAMGRAIVREPKVFLMDEPLSNLDAQLRVATRAQIVSLQRRLGVTTVYVTHDQVEAMTMGHRVAVLRDGVLQQCDTPRVLFDRPANAFVAGFIGSPSMNLVRVPLDEEGAVVGPARVPVAREARAGREEIIVGVRPEGFEFDGGPLPATVEVVEELGSDAYVYATAEVGGERRLLTIRAVPVGLPEVGSEVGLTIRTGTFHLFDPVTERRIHQR